MGPGSRCVHGCTNNVISLLPGSRNPWFRCSGMVVRTYRWSFPTEHQIHARFWHDREWYISPTYPHWAIPCRFRSSFRCGYVQRRPLLGCAVCSADGCFDLEAVQRPLSGRDKLAFPIIDCLLDPCQKPDRAKSLVNGTPFSVGSTSKPEAGVRRRC